MNQPKFQVDDIVRHRYNHYPARVESIVNQFDAQDAAAQGFRYVIIMPSGDHHSVMEASLTLLKRHTPLPK